MAMRKGSGFNLFAGIFLGVALTLTGIDSQAAAGKGKGGGGKGGGGQGGGGQGGGGQGGGGTCATGFVDADGDGVCDNGGGTGGGVGGGGGKKRGAAASSTDSVCGGGGQGTGQGGGTCGGGGKVQGKAGAAMTTLLNSLPVEEVTQDETDGLKRMREEEKLAQDIYIALTTSGNPLTFKNIAKAETTHFAAVKLLLDRYAVVDPAQAESGKFTDPELQAAYDALIVAGQSSVAAALAAGLEIEEIDIADLASRLEKSDNKDIRTLYQNLMRGSRNHLRAFNKVLLRKGGAYEPKHLTKEAFDAIIASPQEKGLVDADGKSVRVR